MAPHGQLVSRDKEPWRREKGQLGEVPGWQGEVRRGQRSGWALSDRQVCREEEEAEGTVGRAGQVGSGSSEEQGSCVLSGWVQGAPSQPCTGTELVPALPVLVRHCPLVMPP